MNAGQFPHRWWKDLRQKTVDNYVGEVLEQQGSFEENGNRKDIYTKN